MRELEKDHDERINRLIDSQHEQSDAREEHIRNLEATNEVVRNRIKLVRQALGWTGIGRSP